MATYQTELPETNSPMSGFVNSSADINKAVEVARGDNGVRPRRSQKRYAGFFGCAVLEPAVRLHSPSTLPTTLPLWSITNIACPPRREDGLSCGELRCVNSTRTYHLFFSVFALKVHGVAALHLLLTWRLATSIAPCLSRAAAHEAHEAMSTAMNAVSEGFGIA
jgi:hypothetical protein